MHAGTGSFPHFERSLLLQKTVGMQVQTGSEKSPCRSPLSPNPEKQTNKKTGIMHLVRI